MRSDVAAPADYQLRGRSATVTLYPTSTPQDLIEGTASGGVDLSSMAAQIDQSDDQATVRLRYHTPPTVRPGACLQIKAGADVAFNGIVEGYSQSEARGDRQMTLKVRRRDALPHWREFRRMTDIYSIGTDLGAIARGFAANMGLAPSEYSFANTGIPLAHDSWQVADLSAWQILTQLSQPGIAEPFVDALGVFKIIDRDVRRHADLTLTDRQVLSVERNRGRPPASSVCVKWQSPEFVKVSQQERVLASATLTAGFFKRNQAAHVRWSDDGRLRADNVRMNVKQSVNAGLLPVGEERFEVLSPFEGKVSIESSVAQSGAELVIALAGLKLGDAVPDQISPFGFTIPSGRLYRGVLEVAIWYIIFALGQGIYEFVGTPYDYVYPVNETEAYDKDAPEWFQKREEFENDLIPNDSVASALATAELIFRNRQAANKGTIVMLDDLRIEPGDLLGMPDGGKFYVEGYSRSLTRGAEPTLELGGFFV